MTSDWSWTEHFQYDVDEWADVIKILGVFDQKKGNAPGADAGGVAGAET